MADKVSFPLTPALSLGERGNGPPSLGHTRDGISQARVRNTNTWRRLFPLPGGEGQGEGEQSVAFPRSYQYVTRSLM